MKNTVKQNTIYLTALQGFNYVVPLVTVVYLVRIFGPSGYGRVALAQAYIQLFSVAIDYGFALSATRSIACQTDDIEKVRVVFRAVIFAKLLLALLLLPVMLLIAWWLPSLRANLLLCCGFYLGVTATALLPSWLYQGFQRMGMLTLITALPRIVSTLTILALIHRPNQLAAAVLLLAISPGVAAAWALVHCRHWLGLTLGAVSPARIAEQLRDGWHVFLATASGAVYTSSPTLVLGLLAPTAVVGYFAAAERVMKAAQNLFTPVTQAVYPYLAQLFQNARDEALVLLGKLLLLVLIFYGLVAIVCQLAPATLLHLILGQRFEPAANILRILVFYPLLIGINIITGALYLVPLNHGRALSRSVAIPTFFHVLLLYPLARFAGAQGVASLLLMTEITILAMRVHFIARNASKDFVKLWQGLTHPLQPPRNPP